MMKYAPPASTGPFVAMADRLMVVKKELINETKTMSSDCQTPAWPTTKKKRRNMSTPHIFSHVGTRTPLMVPRSWPPAIVVVE